MKSFIIIISFLALGVLLLVGCNGGEAVPFSMRVVPQQMDDSIPEQRCMFLVTVDSSDAVNSVNISASTSGASVSVNPDTITPGQVAEVTVIPSASSINTTLTITIEGERRGLKQIETTSIIVGEPIPEVDDLTQKATEVRDAFIPWLVINYPEFGITEDTEWTPTIVRPNIVVVMYYLFYSDEWEMGVRWHVMIPPHDFGEIYLRHRIDEVSPSYAFKISSLEGETEPEAVEPEELIWR